MVELSIEDGIAWLILNRPGQLNALNLASVTQFEDHVKILRRRRDVRVVITCGRGRAFCAGSDIRELAGLSARDATRAERRHAQAFRALTALPQPTVAMLHGFVLGGGLGLALYHDFRIVATDATLALPEVQLGWTPPWAIGRLAHVTGHDRARWLATVCERIMGAEAVTMGLANEAVSPRKLKPRVVALAKKLAAMPQPALARTKKLFNQMSPLLARAWDDRAARAFEACYATPQARDAVASFLERRKGR